MVFFLFWVVKYFSLLFSLLLLASYLFAGLSLVENSQLFQVLLTYFHRVNFNLNLLLLYLFCLFRFSAIIFRLLFSIIYQSIACLNWKYILILRLMFIIRLNQGIRSEYLSLYLGSFWHTLMISHLLLDEWLNLHLFQRINCWPMLFSHYLHTVW